MSLYVRVYPDLKPVTPDVLAAWNEATSVRLNHNCYTFALGALGTGWQEPGDLKNAAVTLTYSGVVPRFLHRRLCKDGLIPIAEHSVDPKNSHIVACFCNPMDDFHFYRLSSAGWSEKGGKGEAKGFGHNNIFEVAKKSAPEYSEFVGFFVLPADGVIVRCKAEEHYDLARKNFEVIPPATVLKPTLALPKKIEMNPLPEISIQRGPTITLRLVR